MDLIPFDKRFSCSNLDKVTAKLPRKEIIELQNQHNVNVCDGNDETWFDDEIPVTHVTVIDEDEFFIRYFGEDYDG